MFRNILTPLAARFPFPAAAPEAPEAEDDVQAPEDFERDARIEEMRFMLEDIKSVAIDDIPRKMQVRVRM